MEWPISHPAKPGSPVKFQTTPTNQGIWTAALDPATRERPELVSAWRKKLENGKKQWRQTYIELIEDFVKIHSQVSDETCVAMCRAGLEEARKSFVFRTSEGAPVSIQDAFYNLPLRPLTTETYCGKLKASQSTMTSMKFASPHGDPSGEPLWLSPPLAVAQIEAFEKYGCMEPSASEHACSVLQSTQVVTDFEMHQQTYVLLGVTSELGPAKHWLRLPNVHMLGVARSPSKIKSLVKTLESEGYDNTVLKVVEGGADLLKQGPQIAKWIVEQAPKSRSIVIVPLIYMDGEANCRATVAMDEIISYVRQNRMEEVALVYYTSPATCYTIPPAAATEAQRRYESEGSSLFPTLARLASLGSWLQPSNTWKQVQNGGDEQQDANPVLFNGLAHLQGPNYALAKTMQQWRCIVAAAEGLRVAAPHAPGSRTVSVVHSAEAAAAIEGIQCVPPMITFDVPVASSLLAAIIPSLLLAKKTGGDARRQGHPMEVFWEGSVHGGSWRSAYSIQSCFVVAYILGKTWCTTRWCPPAALGPDPLSIETGDKAMEEP